MPKSKITQNWACPKDAAEIKELYPEYRNEF